MTSPQENGRLLVSWNAVEISTERLEPLVSPKDLAKTFGCSDRTIRNWADAGCPCFTIMGLKRFRLSEVREWTEQRDALRGRPGPTEMKGGRIYFIGSQDGDNPIKIGWTSFLEGRIPLLQTGSWEELVCHGTLRGNHAAEAAIHAELAEHRVRGEWFARGPALALLASRSEGRS